MTDLTRREWQDLYRWYRRRQELYPLNEQVGQKAGTRVVLYVYEQVSLRSKKRRFGW